MGFKYNLDPMIDLKIHDVVILSDTDHGSNKFIQTKGINLWSRDAQVAQQYLGSPGRLGWELETENWEKGYWSQWDSKSNPNSYVQKTNILHDHVIP